MSYQPPFSLAATLFNRVTAIGELLGRLAVHTEQTSALRLRRINRIRTIQGSLAIEGNYLLPGHC
ncbi:MAG: hypothetical protein OZ916_06540 [Nitrosomonas sp.]|uniref:hypothetical protein n=1 Tax=Nitrosomonas sp. TaxID=42353 RepID=UPI002B3C6093|nr:hypothetical protein [Nitrosomonas sp.]MEB2331925.1 hypothetical protein [Nitrosomonas sp.]HNR10726.1 hypothetical protein [Nitrosomonas europaea]HNS57900.1 hypothetical protein [Nitrosomonas europaea]